MVGKVISEAQHQSALMEWAEQSSGKWPELALLYHIPNGGYRNPKEASHLKKQGVKPGVPDLCLPVARGGYHGLYIELKTEKGNVSQAQKWWGEQLVKQGYSWKVCRGFEKAICELEGYLSLNGDKEQ